MEIIEILSKCKIAIEGNVISNETLMKYFSGYLSTASEKDEHNTGFVLHTGSICFDALAIVHAAITCMISNESDTDDIISSLRPGDLVLYTPDKRPVKAEFQGFYNLAGTAFRLTDSSEHARYIKLICKKKRRNRIEDEVTYVPKNKWNRIAPYFGNSSNTDGRGIRKTTGLRDVFYLNALGFSREEIPSVVGASGVIVMQRERSEYLYKNISIELPDKTVILLSDLVTASYFTDSDEYLFSGNLGKNEPVLKFTGKVSVAKKLAFSKKGNKTIGAMIIGDEYIRRYLTEVPQILNRRSLKYVFLMGSMESEAIRDLLEGCESPTVFACSKKLLTNHSSAIRSHNRFTSELEKQVSGIINREVSCREFSSDLTWTQYKKIKHTLQNIKRSDYSSEQKDDFVITAYSLLNLFSSAVFRMSVLEKCIEEGKIGIVSPAQKLENLKKLRTFLPDYLQESACNIADCLKELYTNLYEENEKEKYLKKELYGNFLKKYAVILPKAYYKTVMYECGFFRPPVRETNVTLLTANNSFPESKRYDKIIVTGNFSGTRFDTFRCIASESVESLIYSYEKQIYTCKKSIANKNTKYLNALNAGERIENINYEDDTSLPPDTEKDALEIVEIDREVDDYIDRLNDAAYGSMFIGDNRAYGTAVSHVIRMGKFETGERIFFTKRYKAYTYNEFTGEVKETSVTELEEGLSLVFTQNNSDTKDIVDDILNRLINRGKLSTEIVESYSLSRQWKDKLRQYKDSNHLKSSEIARKMISYGVNVQEVAIRGWLDPDAHTVGPREKASIEQIAILVGDDDMFFNSDSHYLACKTIRKVRREILGYIGEAIIDKLSGKQPKEDAIMSYIYDRIDSLAVVLRLESIVPVDREIPFNYANRPLNGIRSQV